MNRAIGSLTFSLMLLLLLASSLLAQSEMVQLRDMGPRDSRINIVILSEAYTLAQRSFFDSDAETMVNYMLSVSPLSEYSSFYNVFAIWVPSAESGADHPSAASYSDTYFNSTYDSYGIQRLITIPPNDYDGNYSNGAGRVDALLAAYVPEYDIVVIIVNDPVYGGSGGTYALTSTHSSAPEIVTHELGHSFAELGDEYESAYPGFPDFEEPNTTQETTRELIKWNPWILPGTPIPTPETSTYNAVVGLFEGAHYHSTGWYRPKLQCKMRSLGVEFCEICSEQLVLSEYRLLSPIDSIFPDLPALDFVAEGSQLFRVAPLIPSGHNLDIQWFIDDVEIVGATFDSITISGSELGDGIHSVRVDVIDNTDLTRMDPEGLLNDSYSWSVTVTGSCCQASRGNANYDSEDKTNVADVSYLVSYLFGIPTGPVPACEDEANANGDIENKVNVADVSYLVAYLFGIPTGPAPPLCP